MRVERHDLRDIGIIAAVGILLCAGVWLGIRRMHASLDTRAEELSQRLGLHQGASSLTRLREEVGLLEIQHAEQSSYLPSSPETGEVYAAISEAFNDLQVSAQTISAESPEAYRRYGVVPVRVFFESGFPAVQAFVQRIEAAHRLIHIDRLEIETDPRHADRLRVTVKLAAYYADPQALSESQAVQ